MSNFIKLSELIKRDLQKSEPKKYQVQGTKNSNIIKVAYVEKEKNADVCLAEHTIDNITFCLLAYTLSDNDIQHKRFYMIGYLIKNTQKKSMKKYMKQLKKICYQNETGENIFLQKKVLSH